MLVLKRAKQRVLISLMCAFIAVPAIGRELVIAIEGTLQGSTSLDAMARSQMLVRNLKMAEVPQAMFLIRTESMGAKNRERVALYSNQGHLLVNAGHDHSLVTKSDLYAYEVSILKANRLLRPYSGYKKHLHFSYLNETGDPLIQRGLIDFLNERGYKPAFTGFNPARGIDTYVDQLYQARIRANRRVDMAGLEKAYIQLMMKPLQQQDAYLFNMLGYSPRQVLVVQENDLAAYFIVGLVDELAARGWKMIAAEKALNDPIVNPMALSGWGANSHLRGITGLPDQGLAYPRLIGLRKAEVDHVLNQFVPGFTE